jgi:putative membrane protein
VNVVTQILIGLVALLHLYFLALEMFFWDKPLGRRVFNLTPEFAAASKALAANQGLYNGFLAAGLIWSFVLGGHEGFHVAIFFLACVIVAGIYGAATVNKRIFFFQALPAILALVALHLK